MSKAFPGQTSMWHLTAAQRMLLLGPPKVTTTIDGNKPNLPKKPDVGRWTMEQMQELSAKTERRKLDKLLKQVTKENENAAADDRG